MRPPKLSSGIVLGVALRSAAKIGFHGGCEMTVRNLKVAFRAAMSELP